MTGIGMLEKIDIQKTSVTFTEAINPLFSKAKITIMYADKNRNGYFISEDVVNNAVPTLYGIPIVAHYIEELDNFAEHEVQAKRDKNDKVRLTYGTTPIGFVPESANVYWEEVVENSGLIRKYLVVDGAIIWTGRYPELNVLKDYKFGQSMEITQIKGKQKNFGGSQLFDLESFVFSALCVLGIDKGDGIGHQEPAFESASIVTYKLADDFDSKYKEMIEELKFSLKADTLKEGGNDVTEKIEKAPKKEDTETTVVETEEFALTHYQLREEFASVFEKKREEDSVAYWYVDHSNSRVAFENGNEDWQLFYAEYSLVDNHAVIDFEGMKRARIDIIAFEEEGTFSLNTERMEDLVKSQEVAVKEHEEALFTKAEELERLTSELTEALDKVAEFSKLEAELEEVRKENEEFKANAPAIEAIEGVEAIKVQVELDIKETEEFKAFADEFKAVEAELTGAKADLEKAHSDNSAIQEELNTLVTYKRERQEGDLKEKFSGKLSDEDFDAIFTEMKEDSLERVEERLFAEVGKKNFTLATFSINSKPAGKLPLEVAGQGDKKKSTWDEAISSYLEQ